MIELYVRQGLTLEETARSLGVSREPVRRLLAENGIARDSQGYRKLDPFEEGLRRLGRLNETTGGVFATQPIMEVRFKPTFG